MKIVLFGASGMVGGGVLLECLDADDVESVLSIGRRPCGVTHPKLREILRDDLSDLSGVADELTGLDACFYCLGIASSGMTEEAYRHVTYDLTIVAAEALWKANPDLAFCFVSGQGTDSTEQGRFMWARVKGATENRLKEMSPRSWMFRPGFIQPMRGVRSRTPLYRALYAVVTPLFPVLRRAFPGSVTTTVTVGRAMLRVAREGADKRVLESADINELGRA